jgi:hypothetical protein
MKTEDTTYSRYTDGSGEEYYCPMNTFSKERALDDEALEACVEASTVGRYSGNLEVIDRFTSN